MEELFKRPLDHEENENSKQVNKQVQHDETNIQVSVMVNIPEVDNLSANVYFRFC